MRRRSTVALLAALMVMAMTLGASAAFAGEMTGNGKDLWTSTYEETLPDGTVVEHHTLHGKSICAFSGQNDGFHHPELVEFPGDELLRVQSWGQIPKEDRNFLTSIGHNPGVACRGNAEPPPE